MQRKAFHRCVYGSTQGGDSSPCHGLTTLGRRVSKPSHAVPGRSRGQLAGDPQLCCAVLYRLKRTDRPAELVPRFDKFCRSVRAPGDDPSSLHGHHRHEDVGGLVGVDAAQMNRRCDIDVAEPSHRQVASEIDAVLDGDVNAGTLPIDHEPVRRAV
jgi:hypothetical protein